MIFVSRLFAAFLVLTMVATTGSMAVMRDRDAGTQTMVICNGAGLQTILLDANGERVDPAPICPDCTMVVLADAPHTPDMVLQGVLCDAELMQLRASQAYAQRGNAALNARAPPVG